MRPNIKQEFINYISLENSCKAIPQIHDALPICAYLRNQTIYLFCRSTLTTILNFKLSKLPCERAHVVQTKCTFCGSNNHSAEKCFKKIRKEKEKARTVDVTSIKQMERTPQTFFRCVSEDHMIAKCPKPPKDNEKRRKQVHFIEKGNRTCNNRENNDDHKI